MGPDQNLENDWSQQVSPAAKLQPIHASEGYYTKSAVPDKLVEQQQPGLGGPHGGGEALSIDGVVDHRHLQHNDRPPSNNAGSMQCESWTGGGADSDQRKELVAHQQRLNHRYSPEVTTNNTSTTLTIDQIHDHHPMAQQIGHKQLPLKPQYCPNQQQQPPGWPIVAPAGPSSPNPIVQAEPLHNNQNQQPMAGDMRHCVPTTGRPPTGRPPPQAAPIPNLAAPRFQSAATADTDEATVPLLMSSINSENSGSNGTSSFINIPNGGVVNHHPYHHHTDNCTDNTSGSATQPLHHLERCTLSLDHNNNHRGRLRTMLICFMFLVSCVIFTNVILAVIHDFVPRTTPLPDIWFVFIAERPIFSRFAEICMATCGLTACYITFIHPQRVLVASRAFYLAGMLYLARSVCMGVTLLPIPAKDFYCAPQLEHPGLRDIVGRVVGMIAGLGTEASGFRSACGDLIYSGHTIAIVLSCMMVKEYSGSRGERSGDNHHCGAVIRRWLPSVLTSIGGLGLACIMISRIHYTIDVVLAYYFTTRIFYSYHTILDLRAELGSRGTADVWARRERGDVVTKYLWYPMVRYIEEF